MAEWKFIYQAVAVVVIFYITYQAYLVSRINLDGTDNDYHAAKNQYEHQLVDRLNKLEGSRDLLSIRTCHSSSREIVQMEHISMKTPSQIRSRTS